MIWEKEKKHTFQEFTAILPEERRNWVMSKKILKASAGTGKTYRLSLEYIANLIKGISYKYIIVMTFTKKATAEIKDRIYDFLYQIAFEKYKFEELEKSLKEIYGFQGGEIDKNSLQNIYFEMIKNKDEIRIYTIDGFTNQIFKNTIAPFFGIYGYETLDEEDDGFYEDILVKILNNNEYFEKFSFVFEEKKERKDIKKYVKFIKNIINIRKDFILAGNYKIENDKKANTKFVDYLEEIFDMIGSVAENKDGNVKDFVNTDFRSIYDEIKGVDERISKDKIENKREKIEIIQKNHELFFSGKNIWNGSKIKGKSVENIIYEMKESRDLLSKSFSDYI